MRGAGKVCITFWLTEKQANTLDSECAMMGVSKTEFLKQGMVLQSDELKKLITPNKAKAFCR